MAKPAILELARAFLDLANPANDEHFRMIISAFLEGEILTVEEMARICDTSEPIIRRWASGKSTSQVKALVYRFLAEELDKV